MNKQFNIKPAQLLKSIAKSASKLETTNILKFALLEDGPVCCDCIPKDSNMIALPR